MKKRTIALAVAGMMFGAGSALAEVSVNGYTAVEWHLTDEAAEEFEGQFSVPETEVNFDSEHLFIAAGASHYTGNSFIDSSDFAIGQAFVKYMITEGWMMKAGKFDSNITADAGNAPDREFVQHSILFDLLTQVGGQSMTGVAVAGDVGPATVTLVYANDTSVNPAPGTDGENSFVVLVNASPMDGLDLEFALLTQDENGGGVGNIMDINGTYMINGFTVGLDYATGSDNEDVFENGYSVWAGYDFGNGFNVKARMETASADGADDTDATELQASYALNDNLAVAVSMHNIDDGTNDADTNVVQLIGTF